MGHWTILPKVDLLVMYMLLAFDCVHAHYCVCMYVLYRSMASQKTSQSSSSSSGGSLELQQHQPSQVYQQRSSGSSGSFGDQPGPSGLQAGPSGLQAGPSGLQVFVNAHLVNKTISFIVAMSMHGVPKYTAQPH